MQIVLIKCQGICCLCGKLEGKVQVFVPFALDNFLRKNWTIWKLRYEIKYEICQVDFYQKIGTLFIYFISNQLFSSILGINYGNKTIEGSLGYAVLPLVRMNWFGWARKIFLQPSKLCKVSESCCIRIWLLW